MWISWYYKFTIFVLYSTLRLSTVKRYMNEQLKIERIYDTLKFEENVCEKEMKLASWTKKNPVTCSMI